MPEIRWTDLPADLRQHLFDRVADRQTSAEDLYKLKLWRESECHEAEAAMKRSKGMPWEDFTVASS